ncbi:uncharacterized protein JN550_004518 [Neoarthrinium moseri]|uniref:uncharacterized protein n=1 Tax=Neoarthrinium moseri TaxID=1658444 RepID=UPI001FDB6B9D|nr:uncharacterized protein JN550_004518 [Neoarthrinium moseri]KAI1871524.1 hypothetical protein JN550_004518 [Neoarthrinium moseri]
MPSCLNATTSNCPRPYVGELHNLLTARDYNAPIIINGSGTYNTTAYAESLPFVRTVTTTTAVIAAALVGTTYIALIRYSAQLFGGIMLPAHILWQNVRTLSENLTEIGKEPREQETRAATRHSRGVGERIHDGDSKPAASRLCDSIHRFYVQCLNFVSQGGASPSTAQSSLELTDRDAQASVVNSSETSSETDQWKREKLFLLNTVTFLKSHEKYFLALGKDAPAELTGNQLLQQKDDFTPGFQPIMEDNAMFHEMLQQSTTPSERIKVSWLHTASPAMRNAIQLAIWQWVSLWLTVIMITNTLVYNGFITSTHTTDMGPRLFLVSLYGISNIGLFFFSMSRFCHTYTSVMWHACWAILLKAKPAIIDGDEYRAWSRGRGSHFKARTYSSEVLGELKVERIFQTCFRTKDGIYVMDQNPSNYPRSLMGPNVRYHRRDDVCCVHELEKAEESIDKDIHAAYEVEIKVFEKATEAAADRVAANVLVILGIILATGLSPWTSNQLVDSTSTQLGSYALLLSTGTGLTAMMTSTAHLDTMKDTASSILRLAESTLERKDAHTLHPQRHGIDMEFTMAAHKYSSITLRSLFNISNPIWSIFFGPAFVLLPIRRRGVINTPTAIMMAPRFAMRQAVTMNM